MTILFDESAWFIVKSFHEKAGETQGGFVVAFDRRVVFLRTEPPLGNRRYRNVGIGTNG
jgi:hypothetical protein